MDGLISHHYGCIAASPTPLAFLSMLCLFVVKSCAEIEVHVTSLRSMFHLTSRQAVVPPPRCNVKRYNHPQCATRSILHEVCVLFSVIFRRFTQDNRKVWQIQLAFTQ